VKIEALSHTHRYDMLAWSCGGETVELHFNDCKEIRGKTFV
jgi:hypothetical protein